MNDTGPRFACKDRVIFGSHEGVVVARTYSANPLYSVRIGSLWIDNVRESELKPREKEAVAS